VRTKFSTSSFVSAENGGHAGWFSDVEQPADANLEVLLDRLQRATIAYFVEGSHPASRLPYDRRLTYGPARNDTVSVGGVGFAFMALVVGVYRGWISRNDAVAQILTMLSFLGQAPRFHGAFPHFINGSTAELVPFSRHDDGGDIVETSLLLQGMICAREFFVENMEGQNQVRRNISAIIDAVEWSWYAPDRARRALYWHWSPKHEWRLNTPVTGWNEALVAYVLAAGSKQYPIDTDTYHSGWTNYGQYMNGRSFYGVTLPLGVDFGGPLFLSQYSFCGLDPRRLRDDYLDYEDQVVAHARINYLHCKKNPNRHGGYGQYGWGLSASHGPEGYLVSCPVNDKGILTPAAALAAFPFLPNEAEDALRGFLRYANGRLLGRFGIVDAFSPHRRWNARTYLAINQGPIVAMVENYRSRLLWRLFMQAPEVRRGLQRLGVREKAGVEV
jgi:hypothetical protein